MNFWTILSQTNSIVAQANTLVQQSLKPKGQVILDYVSAGEHVLPSQLEAELFPSSALVVDPVTNKTMLRDKMLIGVSAKQIFELVPLPCHNRSEMLVREAYDLHALAKLKFKKPEFDEANGGKLIKYGILILELKSGKTLKFLMRNPVACVNVLKNRMTAVGLPGSVSKSWLTLQDLKSASECMKRSQQIEMEFSLEPSLLLIQEMMYLLRSAAEHFSSAGDASYEQVMAYMQAFLKRQDVLAILDAQLMKNSGDSMQSRVNNDHPANTAYTPLQASSSQDAINTYDGARLNKEVVAESSPISATVPSTTAAAVSFSPARFLLTQLPSEEEQQRLMAKAVRYHADDDDDDESLKQSRQQQTNVSLSDEELDGYLRHMDKEFEQLMASFTTTTSDGDDRDDDYHKEDTIGGDKDPAAADDVDIFLQQFDIKAATTVTAR